jgi:hypothetical protein
LQKYENALYLIPFIANAVRAGRMDEARNAVARLSQIAPGLRVARVREVLTAGGGAESIARALSDAGVPE